jgi:hypothetical protein
MEPPFQAIVQLCHLDEEIESAIPQRLPDYPRISLQNEALMLDFLEKQYCSPDLDRIADKLWWMSKHDSANISPLHRQYVKRRNIIVTEDPKLHLVWIHDRIFIKPLPQHLTSHDFWKRYLGVEKVLDIQNRRAHIRKAALGFLRTYFYLVQSVYDFHIAKDPSLRLIPMETTWPQFCDFISDLAKVIDQHVSLRYEYGEIRLTRLNAYSPFLLGKANFQRVEYQYGTYFAQFYGPILFVIGMISTILSGLQVGLAVKPDVGAQNSQVLQEAAFWFSLAIVLCLCLVMIVLFFLLVFKVVKEWIYAVRNHFWTLKKE